MVDAVTNAVQDICFCVGDLCALLINRKYVLIQQFCFQFIIQTNEARFLSKTYLLSDNEKLEGCIRPGYHQPLLSFSLILCQLSELPFVSVFSLKTVFVSVLLDLTPCTHQLTVFKNVTNASLLMIKSCKQSLLLMRLLRGEKDVL